VAGLSLGTSASTGLRGNRPALAGKLKGRWSFRAVRGGLGVGFQCPLPTDPAAARVSHSKFISPTFYIKRACLAYLQDPPVRP